MSPKKGKGGRPSGKAPVSKIERKIDIACKRLSVRAVDVLARALDPNLTPDLEYRYRLAAAQQVLDRAWGKPKQSIKAEITATPSDDFVKAMKDAEAREAEARQKTMQLESKVASLVAQHKPDTSLPPPPPTEEEDLMQKSYVPKDYDAETDRES